MSLMSLLLNFSNDAVPEVRLSRAENALTCEYGEFDESAGASCVENDHCYGLGVV